MPRHATGQHTYTRPEMRGRVCVADAKGESDELTWRVDHRGHHGAARRQQLERLGLHRGGRGGSRAPLACCLDHVPFRRRRCRRLHRKGNKAGVPREEWAPAVGVLQCGFGSAETGPSAEHGHPRARHLFPLISSLCWCSTSASPSKENVAKPLRKSKRNDHTSSEEQCGGVL
jgi:hypothetical protein